MGIARLGDQFEDRAEKVLRCYTRSDWPARRGTYVVSANAMPNLQVLERAPICLAIPGSVGQQEFEYVCHGTVNLLTFRMMHRPDACDGPAAR